MLSEITENRMFKALAKVEELSESRQCIYFIMFNKEKYSISKVSINEKSKFATHLRSGYEIVDIHNCGKQIYVKGAM